MTTKYLLPCSCGKKIPVETTLAGQTITCECGNQLEVPTLLRLRSLESINCEEATVVSETPWKASHGIIVVSLVIALTAAGVALYFRLNRPLPPAQVVTKEVLASNFDNLSLSQTYMLWERLRFGLYNKREENVQYQKAARDYRIRLGVTLSILGVATAVLIVGLVASRKQPPQEVV